MVVPAAELAQPGAPATLPTCVPHLVPPPPEKPNPNPTPTLLPTRARKQVYNLTIRQFGALQSIAPNMHQMGYRCAAGGKGGLLWCMCELGLPGACCTVRHCCAPPFTSPPANRSPSQPTPPNQRLPTNASQPTHHAPCRDKAWSVNRLGRIARLHHQPEACVHIINTLYGFNAMEVQEAFVKVSL